MTLGKGTRFRYSIPLNYTDASMTRMEERLQAKMRFQMDVETSVFFICEGVVIVTNRIGKSFRLAQKRSMNVLLG